MSSTEAFSSDELFAHAGWVRGLALRLVRDAAAADDLVQDAFVAALEQKPRADRALEPWLARVVRRRASFLERGRARKADREHARASATESDQSELPGGDELLQRGEMHRRLANAVMELRDPYRSVLLLRFFEDLSPAEIAQRNKVPSATVRSQLKRGLDELRAKLDAETVTGRRSWCLALVPLAVDETARGTWTTISVLTPLLAMQVLTKLALPLAAVVFGAFLIHESIGSPADTEVEAVGAQHPASLSSVDHSSPTVAAPDLEEPRASSASSENREPVARTQAAKATLGHLSGQILDALDGTPVPDFAVALFRGEVLLERLRSDEAGLFESEREYASDQYNYAVVDRDGVSLNWWFAGPDSYISRHPHRGSISFEPGTSVLLEVEVGPTYLIRVAGPPESLEADYTARLTGPDFYTGRDKANPYWTSTPLRRSGHATGELWVRFQPSENRLSTKDGPWRMWLESSDGLWFGELAVDSGNGLHREPIKIELKSRSKFEVHVATTDGAKPDRPFVKLTDLESGSVAVFTADGDSDSSRFVLGAVAPGSYALEATAENGLPWRQEFEVLAGETILQAIVLESRPTEAFVRGELRSETGTYNETVTVFLRGIDGAFSRSIIVDEWQERDAEYWAPFAFEGLPPAQYELRIYGWKDRRTWVDAPLLLDAPVESLVLTCLDRVPLRDFTLHVGIAPGEPEPDYIELASIQRNTDQGGRRQAFGKVFEIDRIPEDDSLDWCVRADGFQPVWGDESDFPEGAGSTEIWVELQAGWGARLLVEIESESGKTPIEGAMVFADGVLVGTTDVEGRLKLALSSKPARLQFEDPARPEFRVIGGDFDLETQSLSGSPMVHRIAFGR